MVRPEVKFRKNNSDEHMDDPRRENSNVEQLKQVFALVVEMTVIHGLDFTNLTLEKAVDSTGVGDSNTTLLY